MIREINPEVFFKSPTIVVSESRVPPISEKKQPTSKFSEIAKFPDDMGYHWVEENGKAFHVDHESKPVYKNRFKKVGDFKGQKGSARAWAKDEENNKFFINSNGERVTGFFDETFSFYKEENGSYAAFVRKGFRVYKIDIDGNIISTLYKSS